MIVQVRDQAGNVAAKAEVASVEEAMVVAERWVSILHEGLGGDAAARAEAMERLPVVEVIR